MTVKPLNKTTKKDNLNCYYFNLLLLYSKFTDAENCLILS